MQMISRFQELILKIFNTNEVVCLILWWVLILN